MVKMGVATLKHIWGCDQPHEALIPYLVRTHNQLRSALPRGFNRLGVRKALPCARAEVRKESRKISKLSLAKKIERGIS
jgi:hypothetical protein